MDDLINQARSQQIECAAYIISGGPDQRGASLGLFDWFAEEFLLERESSETVTAPNATN